MKKNIKITIVLIFGMIVLSTDTLFAKAIVCNSSYCIEYTRVSDDGGNTWYNACCDHFTLTA